MRGRRQAVLQILFAHVYWLKRFPSLHSSANNHRIAELAGLIVGTDHGAGNSAGADDLREKSWRDLLIEIDRQIYPDGVGAEQAPAYTAFAIELFLVAAACLRKAARLAGGHHKIGLRPGPSTLCGSWTPRRGYRQSAIADDGRVIATTQAREPRYVASIVSAVASCIGRPDLAPPASDPSIRDVLFGSAGASFNTARGLRSFPTGGYSVIRGKGEAPAVLTFDHGPVGYLSIAAHGHADTLGRVAVDRRPAYFRRCWHLSLPLTQSAAGCL